MSTRERILAIRLMEKLQNRPEYAKALGIEVQNQCIVIPVPSDR